LRVDSKTSKKVSRVVPSVNTLRVSVRIYRPEIEALKLKRVCRLQFAHLIAKLPRPENSEETFAVFKASCHLLLPV